RTCAFCAIPGIRGKNSSESLQSLVKEAEQMVARGVKEISLIAQDTMRYGADRYGTPRLVPLLRELVQIDGLEWLRLMYTYPTGWRDELIDLLAEEEKLCAYVDMPIQHASDPILKSMNRGTTRAGIQKLIRNLRSRVPNLTIRSSIIAGFPGEQDEHVQELMDFLEEARFNRLAGFLYSHEEGTGAGLMIDDVPEDEKRERLDRILTLQGAISAEISEDCVGQHFRVLIDQLSDDPSYDGVGRTRMDAPEIDGEVHVSGPVKVGEFVNVEITEAFEYDLTGRVIQSEALLDIAPSTGILS
ncbi:MAG: MiaB/RimO family radical SAM methylthiotransferase, partial [bacterium]|nr:MiaB/RimO family radical SAM methylthiotransferase [bacterium]